MKVTYNHEFFKIAKPKIPNTFQEFTQTTLPQLLSPESLPSEYTLRYFDSEGCHIKIRNEEDYQTMCQEMEKLERELFLCVIPEQKDVKMKDILSSMLSSQPDYSPYFHNPAQKVVHLMNRSLRIPIIKLEDEDESKGIVNVENIQDSTSQKTSSLDNVEFVVNESDALRKGLSDRIEESQKKEKNKLEKREKLKDSRKESKRSKEKKGSRLRTELRELERDQKALRGSWESSTEDQSQKDRDNEDLEDIVEKKIQTLPVRYMSVTRDQSKLFDENIDEFQEKWKNDYRIKANLEKGSLQLMAVQEQVTKSRSKPNTTINDNNVKTAMKSLVKALELEDYSSSNIDNLALNFKGCSNLSKDGIAYLFEMINKRFRNVRTLSLDFSFKYIPATFFIELKKSIKFEDQSCDIKNSA